MRKLWLVTAASLLGAVCLDTAPAEAAGGCGWGFHPTLFGCHRNYHTPVVVRPYGYRPVYYPHRYWGWHPWGYGW